ncbi:carbohydrate binding module (family 6) [Streptomyces turgidiscabies Car8]|uniref:Carbohydrate binding module (Family 6) n=1 Tax=Streptomyces turgidiscabies (strain Car8) TaxID=698760 RepID=L7EV98_STRT8|nr:carbohydrate binding module (family 6) [Streptomyces turgidiscabies Car8]GAQ73436.1 endo-1,4-beta-xylanase A precursor [Streptomyces turgidiscabies]
MSGTGGWQTWATKSSAISRVTGTHTVYLTFTSDQSSDFVNLNWFTFTHDKGTDAYGTIQAEDYGDASGVTGEPTGDTGGGTDIGWIADGDWAAYPDVVFGSKAATKFLARVSSGAGDGVSGRIEVRLDSRTSTPVGTITVSDTGGWQTWTTQSAAISGVTGTHTVYLTFAGDQSDNFANLNWFSFAH